MLGSSGARADGSRRRACCVVSLCALVASCGDEHRDPRNTEQSFVIATRVPELGCFAQVESPGSCRRSVDCPFVGDRCVRDARGVNADRAPVPLTCAAPIGTRGQHVRCERGEDCESGLCALSGVCLEPCQSQEDCSFVEACRPVETRVDERALAPVMACTPALVLPTDVTLTAWPGGHDLARGRDDVRVPSVESNALVFLQGQCGTELDLLTLRANGESTRLYDREALREGSRQVNTVLHDSSPLLAISYPNNPSLSPAPSGLTLGVRVDSSQHAEVVVAQRPPSPRGVLDLNLFYVGGGKDIEEGGFHPGERRVKEMLEALDERLLELDLALGEVNEFDVVGALREELSVLDVPRRQVGERRVEGRPERLEELFRISSGLELPGINVFLISEMGDYIGIAGGIPGPMGLHGSERSGVALAADLLGDLKGAEQVLLHEVAHYLGLFHVSESSGTVLDPLTDTAECTKADDTDEDGFLSVEECEGRGSDNLMFWTGPGTHLSAQQVQVLASAVLLR